MTLHTVVYPQVVTFLVLYKMTPGFVFLCVGPGLLCFCVVLRHLVFVFVCAGVEAELGFSSERERDRCGLVWGSHTSPRSTCDV